TRLALRPIHPLPQGERGPPPPPHPRCPLLPSREKGPEGRMRGAMPEKPHSARSSPATALPLRRTTMADAHTGGCQCGAVRFRVTRLGRPSICHCRMCQKAFGGFFGPLVTAHNATWTRGEPKWFQSSNAARRAFCGDCGTPLAYETRFGLELAIGAF